MTVAPAGLADLRQDWHVHSTLSDGKGTLEENVAAAERAGLTLLGCVDHVREASTCVPDLVRAVAALRPETPVTLHACVEAKLLDDSGALDLPPEAALHGIDRIVIADHQVPTPDGPIDPAVVGAAIAGGELDPLPVARWIASATARALERHPGSLIAHLFSVLPKTGLGVEAITPALLATIVDAAARSGALLEVSERWRTPSRDVLQAFAAARVRIVASTDAHRPEDVGQYRYCRTAVGPFASAHPSRQAFRPRPPCRAYSTPRS